MERRGRHTEQRPHGMCCSGELLNKLCRDFCNWLGGMHRAICTTAFRGQQAELLDAWSIVCEAMLMTAPLRDWTKPRSTYFCACFIRTWADAFAFIGDPRLKVGQLHTCSGAQYLPLNRSFARGLYRSERMAEVDRRISFSDAALHAPDLLEPHRALAAVQQPSVPAFRECVRESFPPATPRRDTCAPAPPGSTGSA